MDKLLLNEEQRQHVKMNCFKDTIHPTDFDVMNDDKYTYPWQCPLCGQPLYQT